MSVKKSVVEGALTGLSVWLVYGVVEFVLAVAIPKLWSIEWEFLAWQWPLLALLFGAYAVMGLLSGAAGGAFLARGGRRPSLEDHRSLACLILAVAFAVNLTTAWPLTRSENIALAIAAVLAAAFNSALRSAVWQRRTAFLASQGSLGLLLLIGPWVSREALPNCSGWVKAGVSLLAIGGVSGIAALRHRIRGVIPLCKAWQAAAGVIILGLLWTDIQPLHTAAAARAAPSGAASAGKPNILLITMDTVRADHLSAYGYQRDTTPYLGEFARESTVYERAVAAASFTLPAHASIFTGLYPSWHGATVHPRYPYGRPLSPGSRTLASVLRANGYWTAEAVANYGYLGKGTGLTQGFALTDCKVAVPVTSSSQPFYLREGARKLLSVAVSTAEFREYRLRAPDINRHAFALLAQARNRHSPFFVFLNYMDAHAPYLPPQPFRNRFSVDGLKPISAEAYGATRDAVNAGKRVLEESERRYLVSQYDASIAFVDSQIGTLLTRLRGIGFYDDTLIIITSDHGEAFGERNLMEHGIGSVYQNQVYVPLIVKYPGQHEAHRSDAWVSQVDLMPTVLESAGISVPSGLQGQSLRSPRSQSGAVFAEGRARGQLTREFNQIADSRLRGTRRAMISNGWKLIVWTDGSPELYDLSSDPGELHNLYRRDDPRAVALMAGMSAWAAASPRWSPSQPDQPVDKSTLEKLRSLGYAQ